MVFRSIIKPLNGSLPSGPGFALQLRLDVIERKREEGGEETGDGGGAERRRKSGDAIRRHHLLRLVVDASIPMLSAIARTASYHAREQSTDSILFQDVDQRARRL